MNAQSGRSLIEMLGVMAVAGLITFGTLQMYRAARTRQGRFIAEQELKELAENAKIIYSGRKNYTGISKNFLIKAGALKTEKINGRDFRVQTNDGGKTFSIIFDGLDLGDCAYFATKKFDWADATVVNGSVNNPAASCAESAPNKLEFIAR